MSSAAFLASCTYQTGSLTCGNNQLALQGGGTCSNGFYVLASYSNQAGPEPDFELYNAWLAQCLPSSQYNSENPTDIASVCCDNPSPLTNSAITQAVADSLPPACTTTRCSGVEPTCSCAANQLALASSYLCDNTPLASTILGLQLSNFDAQTVSNFTCANNLESYTNEQWVTCCNSFDLCQASNAPANVDTTGLVLVWPENTELVLTCLPGYQFAGGETTVSVSCNIEDTDSRSPLLPSCYPLPCAALSVNGTALPGAGGVGYGNGAVSAAIGLTGDEVSVTCDAGYGLNTSAVLTCSAVAGQRQPQWTPASPAQSSYPFCVEVSSPLPQLSETFLSQYQYSAYWSAFDPSSLPSGSQYSTATVMWNLTVTLLFPLPSQLSASNAAESGLLHIFSVVLPLSTQQYTVVVDQYRHIEGTLTSLQLFAFNYSGSSTSSYSYTSLSTSKLVRAPCGCNYQSNPAGTPQQMNLTQSFGSANSLDISFLPQSLCNPNYQLASYTTLPARSVIPAVNLSTYFPALPLLQTYYADNADSCPFFGYGATPVASVEWQITGLVAEYCTTVAPQPICTACVPLYIASDTSGATEPDITTCTSLTVQWWGQVSGTVYAGSVGSSAVVLAVTVTAVVTDSNGVPRIFPAANNVPAGLVTAQANTAADGTYTLNLQTPLVLGEDQLTVAVTASRVDYVEDTSRTVLSSAGELVQLSSSAAVLYDDGSSSTQSTVKTTTLSVASQLICPAPTLTHGPTSAQPVAQSPFAFCALLWGDGWTVAYSGVIDTETTVVGGTNVTSSNGVPYVAAGWPVLSINGTRQWVSTAQNTAQNVSFAATYSTANESAVGLQSADQPLLFVYVGLEDYYTYTDKALGVGNDQPATFAHVISAAGLALHTSDAMSGATLPGVARPQSAFALVYDPSSQQYREVGLSGSSMPADASTLSSFTYIPLASVDSVAAMGCSATLPQPAVAYNETAVLQLQASLVAWWPFDANEQDVTGHVNATTAVLHPSGVAPVVDISVSRYGNGSLRSTAYNQSTEQADYLTFTPLPLFTTTRTDGSIQLLSFSVACWLMLDSTALPTVAMMPLVATSLGLAHDFGLSLLWNGTYAFATLHAHFPRALSPASTSTNVASAPLTGRQLPTDQWTHVALTWSVADPSSGGVAVSFYVNGSLVSSSTVAVSVSNLAMPGAVQTGAASYLAGAPGTATAFNGWLDDVLLHNTALTPSQVVQLATYGLPTMEKPTAQVGVTYAPIPSYTECNLTYATSINVTATINVNSSTTVVTTRQGIGAGGAPLVSSSTYSSLSSSSVTWTQPWNQSVLAGQFDLAPLTLSAPTTTSPSAPTTTSTTLPTDWSTVAQAANVTSTFTQPALNLTTVIANLQLLGQLDSTGTQPTVPFLVDGNLQWVPPTADMRNLVQPVTLYLHSAALNSTLTQVRGALAASVSQQAALVATAAITSVANASTLTAADNSTTTSALLASISSNSTTRPPYVDPYVYIGQQGERDSTVSVSALVTTTYLVSSELVCADVDWSTLHLLVQLGSGVSVSAGVTAVLADYTLANGSGSANGSLFTVPSAPLVLTIFGATINSPTAPSSFVLDKLTLTLTGEEAVVVPGSASDIVADASPPLQCELQTLSRVTELESLVHSIEQTSTNGNATGLSLVSYSQQVSGFNFVDQSVVPVSGRITVAYNEVVPGIEVCGVSGIVVQAFDVRDLQFSAPLYSSQPTGNDGSFTLDVLANQPVVLSASFGGNRSLGHTFSPQYVNLTAANTAASTAGVNFVDTTTATLTINIVGGLCSAPIGSVRPVLVVDSCGSTHFPLNQMSWAPVPYVLPAIAARFVSFTAESADVSGLQIPSSPSLAQLNYQSDVNTWLVANGQLQLNFTLGGLTTTLTYTALANIAMIQPDDLSATSSSVPCTDVNALTDTGLPFDIFPSQQPITFVWRLSELYGVPPNQLICGQVNASLVQLWVHDQLSDDQTNPCVQFGCAISGAFDPVAGQTTVTYSTLLGEPFPFARGSTAPPYTRDIHWGEANTVNDEQFVLSLLLTGSFEYGGHTSIKVPPQPASVLLTLRDPPGGGSFTSWTSAFAVNAQLIYTTTADVTVEESIMNAEGFEQQIGVCEGFAAGEVLLEVSLACNKVDENDYHNELLLDSSQGTTLGTTYAQHTSYTDTFTVQTSADPLTNDGDGDMLLIATPTIDIALVTRVDAYVSPSAPGGCSVRAPYDSSSASYSAKQQLNWMGVWEVRHFQIPLAQRTADQLLEQNSGQPYFANAQTQAAYTTALQAVFGWQAILAQNEAQKAAATALGGLVNNIKLKPGYPETVNDSSATSATPATKYSDDNFQRASDSVEDLTDHGTGHLATEELVVSFNGAQGTMAYDLAGEYETSADGRSKTISGSGKVQDTFKSSTFLFVTKIALQIMGSATASGDTDSTTITESTSSYNMHIELSDPDIGDQFDVAIQQDTNGLPVFQTLSGRSSCGPEANTVAREQLAMSLSQSEFTHQDASGVVNLVMSLTNESPFQEAFGYTIWHTINTNGLAFAFNGVDDGYGSNYYLLPPGQTEVLVSAYTSDASNYGPSYVRFIVQGVNCTNPYYQDTTYADLLIDYDTPCSSSEFGGDLLGVSSITIGRADLGSSPSDYQVTFTIDNPNALSGDTWAANADRDSSFSITVQWKLDSDPNTDAFWSTLPLASNAMFDPISAAVQQAEQSSVALPEQYQFVASLPWFSTGTYDLRVINQCTQPAAFQGDPVPLYETISPIVQVEFDPDPPQLVGDAEPFMQRAVELGSVWPLWTPGDFIGATWTEPIDCSASDFSVGMSQASTWAELANVTFTPTPLPTPTWLCEDSEVRVGFGSPDWARLSGSFVMVSVSGVTDAVGNVQSPNPLYWAFQVLPFNTTDTTFRFQTLSLRSTLSEAQQLLDSAERRGMHVMALGQQEGATVGPISPHVAYMASFQLQLEKRLEHNLDGRAQALSVVDGQLQREVVRLLDLQLTAADVQCHWQVEQVVVQHNRQPAASIADERLQGVELLLLPLSNFTTAAGAVSSYNESTSQQQSEQVCSTETAARRLHDCFMSEACTDELDRSRFPLLSQLLVADSAAQSRGNSSAERRWLSPAAMPPFSFRPTLDEHQLQSAGAELRRRRRR